MVVLQAVSHDWHNRTRCVKLSCRVSGVRNGIQFAGRQAGAWRGLWRPKKLSWPQPQSARKCVAILKSKWMAAFLLQRWIWCWLGLTVGFLTTNSQSGPFAELSTVCRTVLLKQYLLRSSCANVQHLAFGVSVHANDFQYSSTPSCVIFLK